jgi:hypothetical protein
MPITDQQQVMAANSRQKSKRYSQDKTHPMCININDGRLFPNVPNVRKNPDYRVYTGDLNASESERMQYLRTGLGPRRAKVVMEAPKEEPFVVGTASKDDLIAFAEMEYGYTLDPNKPVEQLRQDFAKYLKVFSEGDAQPAAETADSLG